MSGRVFFYCQHLLGIGHLRRAATLARALALAGHEVTLVSGGEPVPHLDCQPAKLVQLDPVRAVDKFFKVLVDAWGEKIDDAFKAARAERLVALFERERPDVVLTEMFPFGRRQLRFELVPLLEAAKAAPWRPRIASSVRDILVMSPKPERIDEMLGLVETYYDAVLVHGDRALIPFDATFAPAARIADRLVYTGYVVDTGEPRRGPDAPGHGEIIVSAGGGAVSEPLLEAAMAARELTALKDRTWRLLVGHNLPQERFERLRRAAPAGVVVERARGDFVTLLANAELSISQGGYNTVMETLKFGRRAVVVPYAGGLETEQTLRAELLGRRGLIQIVDETTMTPQSMADAVARALAGPELAGRLSVDLDGMRKSVQAIGALVAQAQAAASRA
ncbi:MAG: glycosyltransferase family protein [Reyranellaceae bacterium]